MPGMDPVQLDEVGKSPRDAGGEPVAPVIRPPADPARLLAFWMEWERAETPPGRTLANLKTGGLRELLELLANPPASPAPVLS